jgi:hypothetical protein
MKLPPDATDTRVRCLDESVSFYPHIYETISFIYAHRKAADRGCPPISDPDGPTISLQLLLYTVVLSQEDVRGRGGHQVHKRTRLKLMRDPAMHHGLHEQGQRGTHQV